MTTKTLKAIYQNGVLKPVSELDLPENTPVHLILTSLPTAHSGVSEQPTPFAALRGVWSEVYFPDSIERTIKQIREQAAEKLERLAEELSEELADD